MLPDTYRDKMKDLEFLRLYADRVLGEMKYEGRPFNLIKQQGEYVQ